MMLRFRGRRRTQNEVVELFGEPYPDLPPVSQRSVSKIEQQFQELNQGKPYQDTPNTLKVIVKLIFF